ncbi:nitrate reductase [Pasteurellaceae bacterium RH1A]|nr:nitrate reductase [Pasteurellaceae bacterium RH1A]
MKKYLTLLLTALAGLAFANPTVEKVPSTIEEGVESVAPAFHNMPKDTGKIGISFVNQPPMIPHSVKGYQVTKNTNQCLSCHGIEHYQTTGAPRISPTHFQDRDGKVMGNTAPRRYFCLQCHVPQADVEPIIENKFKSTFGG